MTTDEAMRKIYETMNPKPGTRVRVADGWDQKSLGEGTYLGPATVYFVVNPDGSLSSHKNAEEPPAASEIPRGARVVRSPYNPKIRLDSGKIVYGCQVWWSELEPKDV